MRTITPEMVDDYLDSFEFFRRPGKPEYLATARDRFVTTLNLIPRLPDPERVRVLEIGGMPYFMTVLIEKFFGYRVEVANEPTWERGAAGNVEVLTADRGDRHEIHYKTLNIENDPWPWPDGSFDIVLYCEVIEHLGYDPTHTLVESHRVLKPGSGQLLISTPNALCYNYLVKMVAGQNYYPPYSGHGFYARHHRLFSPEELRFLCTKIGFQVHSCFSVYDRAYDHPRWLEPAVRALMRVGKLKRRLDVIYLLGSPVATAKPVYPDQWPYLLYGDVTGYRTRLRLSGVRMGDDVTAPLMDGFYHLEEWGEGVRWTGRRARVSLFPNGHRSVELTFHSGPAARGAKVDGWVAVSGREGPELERHTFSVPTDSWETLTFPIPDAPPSELVIELGVDDPLVPSRLDQNAEDSRELGVALREVALR